MGIGSTALPHLRSQAFPSVVSGLVQCYLGCYRLGGYGLVQCYLGCEMSMRALALRNWTFLTVVGTINSSSACEPARASTVKSLSPVPHHGRMGDNRLLGYKRHIGYWPYRLSAIGPVADGPEARH